LGVSDRREIKIFTRADLLQLFLPFGGECADGLVIEVFLPTISPDKSGAQSREVGAADQEESED
jgi:hypothetical protein